ncbi:MAG: hypothetical protein RIF41_27965, partial [Polyangiaceae bacterium]
HADGTGYRGCFRTYVSHVAGAAALLHELYRRAGVPEALRAGDATRLAERMRQTGYFEAPASKYAFAIEAHAAEIASSLGEPVAIARGGVGPALPPALPPGPPALPSSPPTPTTTASAIVIPTEVVVIAVAGLVAAFRRRSAS